MVLFAEPLKAPAELLQEPLVCQVCGSEEVFSSYSIAQRPKIFCDFHAWVAEIEKQVKGPRPL